MTFGYNIAIAENAFIRFGISGGGTWNTIDMSKLTSIQDDDALGNILENFSGVGSKDKVPAALWLMKT